MPSKRKPEALSKTGSAEGVAAKDRKIEIASNLVLEAVSAATQRYAWIATSGGGKTYGCGRSVEQYYAANVPVIVVDTVGVWNAIRLAADGKSPGLPFLVFGGLHEDVPLPPALKAALLAQFIVKTNASVVLDLSLQDKETRAKFVRAFCEALLLSLAGSRRPRMVVFDEAQDVAPEKGRSFQQDMLMSVSDLIRKARNYRCGVSLVTQRPESVNKEVLNLASNLFVGMLHGKHERKAVADWMSDKKLTGDIATQFESTRSFQPGQFLFWSPSWMRSYQSIEVLKKWTFDGSSTQRIEEDVDLSEIAPVDIAEFRKFFEEGDGARVPGPGEDPARAPSPEARPVEPVVPLAELEEIIEQNVKPWRERVGRLRAELDVEVRQTQGALGRVEVLERYVLRVSAAARELAERVAEIPPPWKPEPRPGKAELDQAALAQLPKAEKTVLELPPAPLPFLPPLVTKERTPLVAAAFERNRDTNGASKLKARNSSPSPEPRAPSPNGALENKVQQEVVNVLAAYGAMSRLEVALVSGMSPKSSSLDLAIAALVRSGHIVRSSKGLSAAAAGVAIAECPSHSFGEPLRALWQSKMSSGDWQMLMAVARRGKLPRALLPEALGRPGSKSSSIDLGVSRLKKSGIFLASKGELWLSEGAKRAFGFR